MKKIIVLLLLLVPLQAAAHNGAAALAYPIEGIILDGDLSDWPQESPRYPIRFAEYGDAPKNESDFAATFQVGYHRAESALYVAVEVTDESTVLAAPNSGTWNTQDGCEIYVGVGEGHRPNSTRSIQYAVWGDREAQILQAPGSSPNQGAVATALQRRQNTYYYEWRITLDPARLQPGKILAIDVVVMDKDADGSFSFMSWGKGITKYSTVERCGDLLLADDPNSIGRLQGSVALEDKQAMLNPLIVHIQSLFAETLDIHVRTDSLGSYTLELPAGQYRVETLRQGTSAQVLAGQETQVSLVVHPPTGTVTEAGSGRTIPAGNGQTVDADMGLRRERWRNLSMLDGLPSNLVTDVIQDREGYLWIGTINGISRYDGEHFTTFTTQDGLAHDQVVALLENDAGHLWIGTGNGISRYDGEQFTNYTTQDGVPQGRIGAMLQDSAGHLWIGTGNGISRYDGEHFTTFTTQDGLADNRVYCLLEDAAGSLWVGTEGGISRFDGEYFTNYTTADGLVHNRALSLLNDAAGSLWIGTLGGISRFDGEKFTNYTTADGLAHDRVSRLAKDWTGDLWIGTLGGISRFDGEKFTNYTTADGLVHNQIYDLLVDKAGHLWATTTGGLSQYDGILVSSFTVQDGLADNRLTKLALDHRGTLWIGTAAGLNRYDGEQFVHLATKDGLAHDWIHCLLVDKANHLWIGTLDGLSHYDGEKFTNYTTQNGLANNNVQSLLEDQAGHLWIGTLAGLSRYDGEKFTNYTTQNGLTNNNVRSLLEDKAGHLWIGTLAGLNRYDGKSFESFTTRDGLAHNAVTALLEEEQTDHLWIGTQGGGINRYNGFFFQELSSYDGLINDSVQNLLQDRNGAVWVATAGGLTRLLLRRTTPTIRLTNVVADRAYGPVQQIDLPSSQQYLVFEFGSGHFQMRPDAMLYRYRLEPHEAEWQTTRSGRVEYADLPRGAYTFEVQAIDQNLSYSEDSASVQVQVHLPYGQIALWTTLMLALGVAAWQARKVTLRNRKVRSVNAELSQSNEELQKARHELEQRVEQRTAQLAQRNEELARSNTDLRDFAYVASHDLQEPLRAIMNFGGLLHSRYSDNLDERGQDYLHRMRRAASRSQDLIQGLLAFSRVTQRTEPFVSVDLGEIVRDVVEDLEIRLQQSNGEIHWDDLPTIEADATQMRQLLQNLLHNAIKFRRPQEPPRIDVYAHPLTGTTANETIYELTVKDNGIGFDPKYADRIFTIFQRLHGRDEYEGTGVGLTICRKIAERHRGHIKADSTPGEGTTFTVTLPARQSKSPTAAQDPAADAQHTA